MPVCIAGMHRSGTSMVARLLNLCGLYLGPQNELIKPQADNPDGYWENEKFVQINDGILEELGWGWDFALPCLVDWQADRRLIRLAGKAEMLLFDFLGREPWGWKDPRNCLTLPFWTGFFPDLKIVLCLRNPIEVALSLRRRNFLSLNHSLALWATYNRQALLAAGPDHCLITHFDSYFTEPQKELRRLLNFLNLRASDETVTHACEAVSSRSRHHRFTSTHLREMDAAPQLIRLYAQMCLRAGREEITMTGGAANRHDLPPTSDKLPDPAKGSVASQPQPEATPKVAPGTRGRRQIDYRSVELELLRREVIGLRPQVAQQKAIIKELEGRLKEQSNQLHQANSRITQLEAALRQAQGPNSLLAKLGELQSTVQEVRDWQRQFLTDEWQPRLPDLVEIRQAAERQNGYERLVRRIQQVVHSLLPRNAAVLVLSKGDEALVNLPGVQGWHFLQAEDGSYAGYYPADSTEAINHLEALRARGASYLLVPEPCLWWLDFYAQFREHLETHYPVVFDLEDLCRIFALSPSTVAGETERITIPSAVPERATATFSRGGNGSGRHLQQAGSKAPPSSPALTGLDGNREFTAGSDGRPGILVLGVYLATRANNVEALVTAYAQARRYNVTQRWIALGGTPPSDAVARVTVQTIPELTAKYQLLNDLLGREDLSRYQYLLTTDDDIALPEQFIDRFIALQADLEFAIAQPARTVNSFIDHPIVQQQWGVLARQTRFVEAGPLVSFHRSAFSLILPFDLTSPMGWGYENVWSRLAAEHGLKMGIIDGLPIEHQMRQRGAYYDCAEAERGRRALFQRTRHFTFEECFRVTDVIAFQESPNGNRSNCAATERGHSHV